MFNAIYKVVFFNTLYSKTNIKIISSTEKNLLIELDISVSTAADLFPKSIFIGMDAIVQVVGSWGGYYECIKIFKLFPKFINHCIYRFIATNRHRFSKVWVLLKRA